MNDLGLLLSKIIEKFDIKKLMFSAFIVLALMLVPKINYLHFLMPLDNLEKWIQFIFALITMYIIILVFTFLVEHLKYKFQHRPKKVFMLMGDFGKYINIFYSDEIGEYSSTAVDLTRYDIPKAIIQKLLENNIIRYANWGSSEVCLTKGAIKKLNRIKKIIKFIGGKIKNKDE